jgi:uncharacterized protein YndB with AHSA1/START domain
LAQRAKRCDICYSMALGHIVYFGMWSLIVEVRGRRLRSRDIFKPDGTNLPFSIPWTRRSRIHHGLENLLKLRFTFESSKKPRINRLARERHFQPYKLTPKI